MNPIQQTILQEIVRPAIEQSKTTRLCKVVSYNPKGTIDLQILNEGPAMSQGDSVSNVYLREVQILNSLGVKSEAPEPGDFAYVDLIGGDRQQAILLSLIKKESDNSKTGAETIMPLSSQAPPSWL